MLKLLLLCAVAWSAPKKNLEWKEVWSLAFPNGQPVAAFFDVASNSISVSIAETGGGARVDRVTLEGKLDKARVAKGKGKPGPLRAYGGDLFWINGSEVLRIGSSGVGSEGKVPAELGAPVDIAVARGRAIYVGLSSGALYRLGSAAPESHGAGITGLFLLDDTIHILRGTRLESLRLTGGQSSKSTTLCQLPCYSLERTSAGKWLTTQAGNVLEVNGGRSKVLLKTTAQELGRPAYVYRKDPKDDFFVIPFASEGVIRAFRSPGL